MLCGSLLLALITPIKGEELHPAFIKTPEQLTLAWEKGLKDGKRRSKKEFVFDKFKRGIGSIQVSVFKSETVSYLWFLYPELTAWSNAYEAQSKYLPDAESQALKALSVPAVPTIYRSIFFYGNISLMPSFGGGYGRISRLADPKDLEDVRVVLQVRNEIIQPRKQPGNLLQKSGTGQAVSVVPQWSYTQQSNTTNFSGNVNGVQVSGTGTATTSSWTQFDVRETEDYKWYEGSFMVEFELYDEDGKPRIKSTDKDIEVVVVYGRSERRVKYKLDQFRKVF